MSLKLYFNNLRSPSSRAVYIFLKSNKILFQQKHVDLCKGEHLKPEFTKINPMKQVPVIEHNGFFLAQSSAILRYLCREFNLNDYWLYPEHSQAQAKIDEYLDWYQSTFMVLGYNVYLSKYVLPVLRKKLVEPETVIKHEKKLMVCFDQIENSLSRKHAFLTGYKMTIPDLLCACIVDHMPIAGIDARINRPHLSAWMQRVLQKTSPHYQEAHALFNEFVDRLDEKCDERCTYTSSTRVYSHWKR